MFDQSASVSRHPTFAVHSATVDIWYSGAEYKFG
jgi:hypothetical protein